MKLEIKHLAPYLPYGLKYATLSDDDGETYFIDKRNNTITVDGSVNNVTNICLIEYSRPIYKPILRPLSDLTKEIEINGEKFYPIYRMELLGYYDMKCLHIDGVKSISYNMMQFLLEWHFDVFGLIPNDLAIDVNTLKK